MSTIADIKKVHKPVLQNVISDYTLLVDNIGGIIRETGYKTNFIAKKLQLPKTTFYHKKRTKTFTLDEITQIVGMLDNDEALENEYLINLAESRLDEDAIPVEDIFKKYNYNY